MHVQTFDGGIDLIRFYRNGCYCNRDKYCAVLTLEYNDSGDEVTLWGLFGAFGFREKAKLGKYLIGKGIRKVHREVKGNWKTTVLG